MKLTLINREQLQVLGNFLVDEFDSLISRIRTGWNVQHTEDDGHSDITAYSLTLTADEQSGATGNVDSDGGRIRMTGTDDSQFGGNVTAAKTGVATETPVTTGIISQSGATDSALGPGVEMNGAGAAGAYAAWIATRNTFKELALIWKDATLGFVRPVMLRDDSVLGGYAWMPGRDTSILKGSYLGSNTDTGNRGRWAGAYLLACDSLAGYTERGRSVAMGEWTQQTYAAGAFTTSGAAVWTVDAGDHLMRKWRLVGKTMTLQWALQTTTLSAPITELRIALPGGFTIGGAAADLSTGVNVFNGGGVAWEPGFAAALVGETFIRLFRPGTVNFPASVNDQYYRGSITFEVQ